MKIIIVDEHDKQIGLKEYGTLHYKDIYRASALWLTDASSGDVFIAQRSLLVHNDPGKWSAAVSGTVEKDESYAANMVKEIQEEIGLTGLQLTVGPKEYIDDGNHRFFVQWFLASVDKNNTTVKPLKEEVADTKWIAKNDLVADITNHPEKYTPHFGESLKALGY